MAKWLIEGMQRPAMRPVRTFFEAKSREAAMEAARARGITVNACRPADPDDPEAGEAIEATRAAPLFDMMEKRYASLPKYALALRALAAIQLVVSGIFIVRQMGEVDAFWPLFLYGPPALIGALLLFAFASVLEAARDVAVNSWRMLEAFRDRGEHA